MRIRRLCKKRPCAHAGMSAQALAYSDESTSGFIDEIRALGDSLISGGVLATDTLSLGPVQAHYAVRSPVIAQSDSSGTRVTFGGACPVEVGVSVRHAPASTPPAARHNSCPNASGGNITGDFMVR